MPKPTPPSLAAPIDSYGDLLHAIRKEAGMSQNDIAKELGINFYTLRPIMQGKYQPETDTLKAIIEGLEKKFSKTLNLSVQIATGEIKTYGAIIDDLLQKSAPEVDFNSLASVIGAIIYWDISYIHQVAEQIDIPRGNIVGIIRYNRIPQTTTLINLIENMEIVCPRGWNKQITTPAGNVTSYGEVFLSIVQNRFTIGASPNQPAPNNLGKVIKNLHADMAVSRNKFMEIMGINKSTYFSMTKNNITNQDLLNRIIINLEKHDATLHARYAPKLEAIKPSLPPNSFEHALITKHANQATAIQNYLTQKAQQVALAQEIAKQKQAQQVALAQEIAKQAQALQVALAQEIAKQAQALQVALAQETPDQQETPLQQAERSFKAEAATLFNAMITDIADRMPITQTDKKKTILQYLSQTTKVEIFVGNQGRATLAGISKGDADISIEAYRLALFEIVPQADKRYTPITENLLKKGSDLLWARDELPKRTEKQEETQMQQEETQMQNIKPVQAKKQFTHISEVFDEIRKAQNLTQSALARELGVNVSTMNQILLGYMANPIKTLIKYEINEKLPEICREGWALYGQDFMKFYNALLPPVDLSHFGGVLQAIINADGITKLDLANETGWEKRQINFCTANERTPTREKLESYGIAEILPRLCPKGWALYGQDFMKFYNALPRTQHNLLNIRHDILNRQHEQSTLPIYNQWIEAVAEFANRKMQEEGITIEAMLGYAQAETLRGKEAQGKWKKILNASRAISVELYQEALKEIAYNCAFTPKDTETAARLTQTGNDILMTPKNPPSLSESEKIDKNNIGS